MPPVLTGFAHPLEPRRAEITAEAIMLRRHQPRDGILSANGRTQQIGALQARHDHPLGIQPLRARR